MLVALCLYVGAVVVFYTLLVASAKQEPEHLSAMDAPWQDQFVPETMATEKAA